MSSKRGVKRRAADAAVHATVAAVQQADEDSKPKRGARRAALAASLEADGDSKQTSGGDAKQKRGGKRRKLDNGASAPAAAAATDATTKRKRTAKDPPPRDHPGLNPVLHQLLHEQADSTPGFEELPDSPLDANNSTYFIHSLVGFARLLQQAIDQERPLVWSVVFKKSSGKQIVTYDDLVAISLCYGWIDCRTKSLDDDRFGNIFRPRVNLSNWSESNAVRAARVIRSGWMTEAGRATLPPPLLALHDAYLKSRK